MKTLPQQILAVMAGCLVLTLAFGVGLSIAVNYGLAQFEQQAGEFLPTGTNDALPDSP
ncbi:MAG TPA: hypothetical protein V6D19_18080 [Stenomitos sp.]